jgi:hypothetical protein
MSSFPLFFEFYIGRPQPLSCALPGGGDGSIAESENGIKFNGKINVSEKPGRDGDSA